MPSRTVELALVALDVGCLEVDLRLQLQRARGDLRLEALEHGREPVLVRPDGREERRRLAREPLRPLAGLRRGDELHLVVERVAEIRARDGVVLVARVAEADLRATDLDLPAELVDLLAVGLEVLLVRVDLGVEPRDRAGIARDAPLGVLLQHPTETVDRRVERVDLGRPLRERLRHAVPLEQPGAVAGVEVRGLDRHLARHGHQLAPRGARLFDLAGELLRLRGVEAAGELEPRPREAIEEPERLRLAGEQLGERAHAVARARQRRELLDEALRLTDERLALVHVVDDGERGRAVLRLARPANGQRGELVVRVERCRAAAATSFS